MLFCDFKVIVKKFYLLVWQLVPVNPGAHVQLYLFTPSVHAPPFLHGLLKQSFGSETSIVHF